MEHYIVSKLKSIARDPPQSDDVKFLLRGRTIDRKCRVLRLKYWGHIIRRLVDHVLRKALCYNVPGKLKRGRPCFTWHNSLERAIRLSKVNNWSETVHNKFEHNRKCDEAYLPTDSDESD